LMIMSNFSFSSRMSFRNNTGSLFVSWLSSTSNPRCFTYFPAYSIV
jgi:hypothetical protein